MSYTDIPDTRLLAGKPVSTALMTGLRDNPLAIADGLADAPRIQLGALSRVSAGDVIRSTEPAEIAVTNGSAATLNTSRYHRSFVQAGSIRISFELRVTNHAAGYGIRRSREYQETSVIYIGGVGAAYLPVQIDVDILPGDVLNLDFAQGGNSTLYVRNFAISTNGEALWPTETTKIGALIYE